MKLALLQLNPTVGDLAANTESLLSRARTAERAGASVVLAPELVVCGYPPRDLLDRSSFVRETLAATEHVIRSSSEVPMVFGALGLAGNRLSNDAIVAQNGREIARAQKQLLPSYDVFDERRHFKPGETLTWATLAGQRCAISICEDAWADAESNEGRYRNDPLAQVGPSNTELLLNLSASPFTLHKLKQRPQLFSNLARRSGACVAMANQVGANDELIFDGRSSIWNASGQLVARGKMFETDLVVADLQGGPIAPECINDEDAAHRALVLGIRDYARKCGFSRAVLGLSGGIDSALVAVLAADALGPENVLGVGMPSRYSSEGSVDDARLLASNLGIEFRLINIDATFQSYIDTIGSTLDDITSPRADDVTWENIQARIRGATVMAISNRSGALALTTGNKSEIAVGYCTLYGDMVGGLSVISDVPKTFVYRIARFLNRKRERIPQSTIDKPPSAELRPDQKDEDSLPPYDVLDALLTSYVEDNKSADELVAAGFDAATVAQVLSLVRRAEYKRRQSAPGLILTRKAFGPGRRIPIATRYQERIS